MEGPYHVLYIRGCMVHGESVYNSFNTVIVFLKTSLPGGVLGRSAPYADCPGPDW